MNVRPWLRRVAIAACVVLIPIGAHNVWDYIELRRLIAELDAIRSRGEPLTPGDATPEVAAGLGSGDYYAAAALLARGSRAYDVTRAVEEWLSAARPNKATLAATLAPLQPLLREHADAFELADRAATVRPGPVPEPLGTYQTGPLVSLTAARALLLAAGGDGDGAADAAVAALVMARNINLPFGRAAQNLPAMVLSLSAPSDTSLVQLQQALQDDERPDAGRDAVIAERARHLRLIWQQFYGTNPNAPRTQRSNFGRLEAVFRPWVSRALSDRLRVWAELIDAARPAWPERAKTSSDAVARHNVDAYSGRGVAGPWVMPEDVLIAVYRNAMDPTPLVLNRASQIAVAVERFRRAHRTLPVALSDLSPAFLATVPVDPFTGEALRLRVGEASYVVYSVGADGTDDGGDLTSLTAELRKQGRRTTAGKDIGIRVIVH